MVADLDGRHAHLDDHRCADLVLGLLPDRERVDALAHAAACPACEARLRSHVGATARARADLAPRAASASRVTPLPVARHRVLVPALALAATLLAVTLLPRALQHPVAPATPAWLPAPGETVRLRAGGESDPRLAAGLDAYARHDLVTAERELDAARATGPSESLRRLYLAHAKLAHGDADAAVALLRGVDWRTVPEPWRRSGATLLASALRAAGRPAAADTLARALREADPSTPVLP